MSLASVGGNYKDWRDEACCRDTDPEQFFPVGNAWDVVRIVDAAKAVCGPCPVREACLQYAVETNQDTGVWGGTSEEERRKLRKYGWLGGGLPRKLSTAESPAELGNRRSCVAGVDPAGVPGGPGRIRKGINIVDEDRRRPAEADPLCVLGAFYPLMVDHLVGLT